LNLITLRRVDTLRSLMLHGASLCYQSENGSSGDKGQICCSGSCKVSELLQEVRRLGNENADLKVQLLAAKAKSPEVYNFSVVLDFCY
jgi:hypothetical protein